MSVEEVIEEIIVACEECISQVTFVQTLVGKSKDVKWLESDPNYTMMKTMAHTQADIIIQKAQNIKDKIPNP